MINDMTRMYLNDISSISDGDISVEEVLSEIQKLISNTGYDVGSDGKCTIEIYDCDDVTDIKSILCSDGAVATSYMKLDKDSNYEKFTPITVEYKGYKLSIAYGYNGVEIKINR